MGHGKHLAVDLSMSPAPRTARAPDRLDADADVVSTLCEWLRKSGANAEAASNHYRRTTSEVCECGVGT